MRRSLQERMAIRKKAWDERDADFYRVERRPPSLAEFEILLNKMAKHGWRYVNTSADVLVFAKATTAPSHRDGGDE